MGQALLQNGAFGDLATSGMNACLYKAFEAEAEQNTLQPTCLSGTAPFETKPWLLLYGQGVQWPCGAGLVIWSLPAGCT